MNISSAKHSAVLKLLNSSPFFITGKILELLENVVLKSMNSGTKRHLPSGILDTIFLNLFMSSTDLNFD